MTESLPTTLEVAPDDPPADTPSGLKVPEEIEKLLNETIKKSVDRALRQAGGKLPPSREILVDRVSRELTVEVQRTFLSSYQGPVPPPQMLAEFERIVPGLAKTLVEMALAEQQHRHRWEDKAQWNDIFLQSGGLTLGWCLAGASLVGAFILGVNGKTVEMGIMLGVPAIQMIRSIVQGGQSDEAKTRPTVPAARPPVKIAPKRRR